MYISVSVSSSSNNFQGKTATTLIAIMTEITFDAKALLNMLIVIMFHGGQVRELMVSSPGGR